MYAQALLLAALLPGPILLSVPYLCDGSFLGVTDVGWLMLAIGVPVVHQIMVTVVWRAQLGARVMSRIFGSWDLRVWGVLFLPLLFARPLALLGLGLADAGSAGLPPYVVAAGAVGLALPALYTFWSIHQYFGIPRALGGDHFYERYRVMPMVQEGAFKYSGNAMYGLAFLGLWAIAIGTNSYAALAACLFQHAWIWVHWYCTEKPDIDLLYADSTAA